MTLYVDAPIWPAHGRRWAHLVSDTSRSELHDFAALAGLPARGFDGDHYDVPAESIPALVAAGAVSCSTRELVAVLRRSALRSQRPRSAKPRYASREVAVGAAVVGPGADGVDTGGFAAWGYDVALSAADPADALRKIYAHEPAVDAVVLVAAADAGPALRAVGEDFRLAPGTPGRGTAVVPALGVLDGRTRRRHPAGADIIGRAHFLDDEGR